MSADTSELPVKARVRRRRSALAAVLAAGLALTAVAAVEGLRTPDTPPDPLDAQWTQVFTQTFDTDAPLGTFLTAYPDFGAYTGPWTDSRLDKRAQVGHYDPARTLSASAGAMNIWLHYDEALQQFLVAAPYPRPGVMKYGRFSMRMRADVVDGYSAAPVLWPDSEDPVAEGQINFPQGDLDGKPFRAVQHYATPAGGAAAFNADADPTQWHTYDIAWSPGLVEFFVDGASIGASMTAVQSKPMHWVLQFQTDQNATPSAAAKAAQGYVQIDSVTVYRLTDSPADES